MRNVTISVSEVTKTFNRKILFDKISFVVKEGQSFAITGKNGSGKSTLVKILCGLLTATKGTISYSVQEKDIDPADLYTCIGLVSPYLNMYDEFTGEENLRLFTKIRGLKTDDASIAELLKEFNIYDHRKKEVRYYSSGMKQRLKYCAAVMHQPAVLFLDEPTANLDEPGISIVRKVMERQKKEGSLIFATNETEDLKHANSIINLD